jgi:thioesterase domain-containing protein
VAAPGVNALGYVALARLLPADQPVYLVQPKRRVRRFPDEGIGPGFRDEYPLVAGRYLTSIRTVQPRGPYQLAGACDGGLIAFEIARQVEAEGQEVSLLAELDTWPLENTSVYPLVLVKIAARGWLLRTPEQRRGYVKRKSEAVLEQGAALLRARPATAEAQPAREKERRAVWRAKLWPGRSFVAPVIKAPIAVLRVAEQPFWRIRDDALGWRGRTTGLVTAHILPGTHESWARSPNVESFGRVLGAHLAPAQSVQTSSPPLAPTGGAPQPIAGDVRAPAEGCAPAATWRGRLQGAVAARVQRGQAALGALLARAADDARR